VNELRDRFLYALAFGSADQLSELLGELYTFSLQTPNKKKCPANQQSEPGTFSHRNAID
jgi:hypothetical protein